MKLNSLEITNFHSIPHTRIEFAPFTLFAGPNWSGKTSIQQAIRMCLTGDVSRVRLKGNYKLLVRDTQKSATVAGDWAGEARTALLKNATAGHQVPKDAVVHPALLDAERFCRLEDDKERVALMMEILCGPPDPKQVAEIMRERGLPDPYIEHLTPFLTSGWDAVANAAAAGVKEARTKWVAATGDGPYGSEKAAAWEAKSKVSDEMKTAGNSIEKNRERVALAQKQLEEHQATLMQLEAEWAQVGAQLECPHCKESFQPISDERAEELAPAIPAQRDALAMLRNAVDTRVRDLENSILSHKIVNDDASDVRRANEAAKGAHAAVQAWTQAAELVGITGIPSEILAPRLQALNERLRESAACFQSIGYGCVQVAADGAVTRDGRIFGLLSEAEQWIAATMVTEALVHVSGAGLFMVDRLDVLWPKYRGVAISWLKDEVVASGTQVICFATLKQKPVITGVRCLWLEGGQAKPTE
jgi:hypothetical protein